MPGAAGEKRVARVVDQRAHLRGLGRDREHAGVDAPRIEQVADEPAHAVGLLVDDAKELLRLGRAVPRRGAEHRRRRALDGGERGAKLVAYHAEELRPHPVYLLERRQVLQGDHHRFDLAVVGLNRRCVDERGDAAPIGGREHDLLGPHRLGAAQRACEREAVERDLAPVPAPAGEDLQQFLGGAPRHAQALHDALRLAIERHHAAGPRIEHHDPDRRSLDQRLEIGACALLVAVGARVGDGARGLRGEQHQDLLVLARELLFSFLLDEVEVADMPASMAHRRALEGPRRQPVRGKAERAHVRGDVGQAQRPREVAEVLEQPQPVGPLHQRTVLIVGETGGDEVLGLPLLVNGDDGAVARPGQCASALRHLAEHGLEVEARADTQHRGSQAGEALVRCLAPLRRIGGCRHLVASVMRGADRGSRLSGHEVCGGAKFGAVRPGGSPKSLRIRESSRIFICILR